MTVIVVPYDPAWPQHFAKESRRIAERLDGIVYRLHHIGSTAIPGIAAKPIIDMLMEVADLGVLDSATVDFEALGYEAMGEFGIPGRRYFRQNDSRGRRTHHLHAFRLGTDDAQRHLAFRDYMIAHPTIARAYGELKRDLARRHPDDTEAYVDGKDAFVKQHQALAVAWRRSEPRQDQRRI